MDDEGTLRPDTEIDHYRIVRILGRGGFGITYEALDLKLKRPVAIKEYFPHGMAQRTPGSAAVQCLARNQEPYARGLERFLEEARALAQFHDPRIVRVHGYLQANSTAYMMMDLEQGGMLRDHVLKQGRLPPEEARRVLIDVLQALRVVHAKNYLHRDIKPSNLLRRPDGQIVLLDFGSARMAQADPSKGHTVVVTPGYAPIEQYDATTGQGPGIDLYATGACLLFCLTGEAPPDGFRRAIAMQSNEPDPVEPLLQHVTAGGGAAAAELCDLVRWLMRPQAARRPGSAQEALDRLRGPESWPSEPTLLNPTSQRLAEMRSIPSKLVEPMRQLLERHVGQNATTILFGSIRSARSAQDLLDRIAAQIPDEPARTPAVDGLRRILVSGQADPPSTVRTAVTAPAGVPAMESGTRRAPAAAEPAPETAQPPARPDEATTQMLTSELAKHIGPIAAMLVKRSMAKAASRQELIAILAAEIPGQGERDAFIAAAGRLPASPR